MRKPLLLIAALAALVAGCSAGDDRDEEAAPAAAEAASAVVSRAVGEAAAPAPAPVAAGGAALATGPRVVQTASLRLAVSRGRFEETVERARTIADGLGGFVVRSSAERGGGRRPVRGTLVVRVPEPRYAQAMAALRRLGRIQSRIEGGEDVSQELVDLEARARHLEAVETQLLELLERARSVAAALAVQSHLNQAQLELEQVRGRLRFLDDQVAFATISLEIRERALPPAGGGDDGPIVDVWREAARRFVDVASRALVALATAAPLVLLAAAAVLAGRAALARRRRRSVARVT